MLILNKKICLDMQEVTDSSSVSPTILNIMNSNGLHKQGFLFLLWFLSN
jgi:hypothetical protein